MADDRQGRQKRYPDRPSGRDSERYADGPKHGPVEQAGYAECKQRQRSAGHNLLGAKCDDEQSQNDRANQPSGSSGEKGSAYSKGRRDNDRAECTRDDRAFQANVDHAGSLDHRLA